MKSLIVFRLLAAVGFSALVITGCAHYPVNAPLTVANPSPGYRFQNAVSLTNSDGLMLALAFSGGGARAAALSYGVLKELANTRVGTPGQEHRLLDDVEVISSVSGGSFTAAYYTLWGDRIFTDFEPDFLKRHTQRAMFLRTLAPWNQVRLASPKFSRSDLAAEYYDQLLFKGATFADLIPQPGRPFLIVSATDLALGARFEFTQDQFDLLHSDLSKFPVGRAVAASSAFPILFTPVVLKNHSAEYPQREPEWIQSVLSDPRSSSRLRNLALQARSYVDGDRRRFIHLTDGAISDFLGLRGPVDRALELEGPQTSANAGMRLPRRFAIIIVDANTDRDYGWDSTERTLGLQSLIGSIGHSAVSRDSFETIELFREVSARLNHDGAPRQAGLAPVGDFQPAERSSYIVELHFNQLSDESDRRFFNSVPTQLHLPSRTVDRLRELAGRELANNGEYRRLVRDLARLPAKRGFPDAQTITMTR